MWRPTLSCRTQPDGHGAEVEPQPVKPARPHPADLQRQSHRRSSSPKKNHQQQQHQRQKNNHLPNLPLTQRIIEAIPTVQAVNTAGTPDEGLAALATPLLLKAIKPTIQKWRRNFSRQSAKNRNQKASGSGGSSRGRYGNRVSVRDWFMDANVAANLFVWAVFGEPNPLHHQLTAVLQTADLKVESLVR